MGSQNQVGLSSQIQFNNEKAKKIRSLSKTILLVGWQHIITKMRALTMWMDGYTNKQTTP